MERYPVVLARKKTDLWNALVDLITQSSGVRAHLASARLIRSAPIVAMQVERASKTTKTTKTTYHDLTRIALAAVDLLNVVHRPHLVGLRPNSPSPYAQSLTNAVFVTIADTIRRRVGTDPYIQTRYLDTMFFKTKQELLRTPQLAMHDAIQFIRHVEQNEDDDDDDEDEEEEEEGHNWRGDAHDHMVVRSSKHNLDAISLWKNKDTMAYFEDELLRFADVKCKRTRARLSTMISYLKEHGENASSVTMTPILPFYASVMTALNIVIDKIRREPDPAQKHKFATNLALQLSECVDDSHADDEKSHVCCATGIIERIVSSFAIGDGVDGVDGVVGVRDLEHVKQELVNMAAMIQKDSRYESTDSKIDAFVDAVTKEYIIKLGMNDAL